MTKVIWFCSHFTTSHDKKIRTRTVKGVTLENLLVYKVANPHGGDPRDPVYPLP